MSVLFKSEDWESDIRDVQIESCAVGEDPLGFRAVFYLSDQKSPEISFRIGASLLAQRAKSLALAGYKAPMTKKALSLLETRIGAGCPA